MKKLILITIVVVAAAAGYFVWHNHASAPVDSGISGMALLGPKCPVEHNPPLPGCQDQPYQVNLAVLDSETYNVIKKFSSDADGKFSVNLKPGTYRIQNAGGGNIYPRCMSDGTVEVKFGAFTQITIACDTGIR